MTLTLRRIGYTPALFEPLLDEGEAGDGGFLIRLRDDWLSGALRFDGAGEILLGGFEGDHLVAVGGISDDPYDPTPGLGRLRHVYVLRARRRSGIGRSLVEALIAHASESYQFLRLRTENPAAARLYEAIGFAAREAAYQTHVLRL